ncbi:MAG: ABC transporter ATP-binding protein [Gammaproteobacteria bacterium]
MSYSDSVETPISVNNLSKCYQIYNAPHDRLKQFLIPRLKAMIGKNPPQYYDEFWALNDISFDVGRGETIGIVGRNGSGKSTLLQIICGTLSPSGGAVETNGRIAALLELGSGFNPEFTGRENVYMNAAVLGLSKEEISKCFDDIVNFADIGPFINQPAKTYSSGMMMRLAFAVAIHTDPQILIIDEALSVGDEVFQRKCFSRIEAIKKKGATILFVSHSGGTVVELCDKAILLDGGEMLIMDQPKRVIAEYQKLAYAPDEKREAIRKMIKNSIAVNEVDKAVNNEQPIEIKKAENLVTVLSDDNHGFTEYFDENLRSESVIPYESKGALIVSPQLINEAGEQVNCLVHGNVYRYLYTVKITENVTNVRFGMMIKTISGVELGGAVSSPSSSTGIAILEKGSEVIVDFQFHCNLNQGSYFLNAGVTGSLQQEETYLHRILDFHMFKVMPVTDNTITGMVDFKCHVEVNEKSGTTQFSSKQWKISKKR